MNTFCILCFFLGPICWAPVVKIGPRRVRPSRILQQNRLWHLKYRFLLKMQNCNWYYFLILWGVTIQHFAVKRTVYSQITIFVWKLCHPQRKIEHICPIFNRIINFIGKLSMTMFFSSLKLTTFVLKLSWQVPYLRLCIPVAFLPCYWHNVAKLSPDH